MQGTQVQALSWQDGEGDGKPLQYSCLENPMDRGAWAAIVRGVAESVTRLSDLHTHSTLKEKVGGTCRETHREGGGDPRRRLSAVGKLTAWPEGGGWTGSRRLICVEGPGREGTRVGGTGEFPPGGGRVFLGRPGGVGLGQLEGPGLASPSTRGVPQAG